MSMEMQIRVQVRVWGMVWVTDWVRAKVFAPKAIRLSWYSHESS